MKNFIINTFKEKFDIIGSTMVGIIGIIAIILGISRDDIDMIVLGLMDLFVVIMFWGFKIEKDALLNNASMYAEYMRIKAKKYYAPEKITEKDDRDLVIINKLTDISLTDEQFKQMDEIGLLKSNTLDILRSNNIEL